MAKIYLAASFNAIEQTRQMAKLLTAAGHTITADWFRVDHPIEKIWDGDNRGKVAEALALLDLTGLDRAEVVIIDTSIVSSTGGIHVELGYVLGYSRYVCPKRVILIGPADNIFYSLITETYKSWEEFFNESRFER